MSLVFDESYLPIRNFVQNEAIRPRATEPRRHAVRVTGGAHEGTGTHVLHPGRGARAEGRDPYGRVDAVARALALTRLFHVRFPVRELGEACLRPADALHGDLGLEARHVVGRAPLLEGNVENKIFLGTECLAVVEGLVQGKRALYAHGGGTVVVETPAPQHGGGRVADGIPLTAVGKEGDGGDAHGHVDLNGPGVGHNLGVGAVVVVEVLDAFAIGDGIQAFREAHGHELRRRKELLVVVCGGQGERHLPAVDVRVQAKAFLQRKGGRFESRDLPFARRISIY